MIKRALILMTMASLAGVIPLHANNLSLEEYLARVGNLSEDLRAIDKDIQSLRAEIDARDLELTATIDVEVNRFWDDRPTLSANPQDEGRRANVVLAKPLATGTRLSLLGGGDIQNYRAAPNIDQNEMNWELGVSQSLWNNSFGRQTSLRRRRDRDELHTRFLDLTFQRQQIIIDFETLFWDLSYAQQEVKIRNENLVRSRRISSYIKDRVSRSAAERTDMLQAQSLVSGRELQLQAAEDNLRTLQARLHELVNWEGDLLPLEEDIRRDRALLSLPVQANFAPPAPMLIEALRAESDAAYLESLAKYEKDQLKPVLELGYVYGQRGLDTSFSTARSEAGDHDNNFHQVGLLFTAPLDFSLISQARRATEARAEAQSFRSNRSNRQSHVQWADLERTTLEQKERVKTAVEFEKFQQSKSAEERSRYQKGRTTAFQAITFELEAAESELLVYQLLAQLRRTEARARAYIRSSEAVR